MSNTPQRHQRPVPTQQELPDRRRIGVSVQPLRQVSRQHVAHHLDFLSLEAELLPGRQEQLVLTVLRERGQVRVELVEVVIVDRPFQGTRSIPTGGTW
jgi:hypothetical protein